MAKARPIEGLTPDLPYREAAARSVRVRADELFEHAEDVLDVDDPERVHAMRVATRRLRAVLELYAPCFPRRDFKPVLRDVKALADALGARRDPDVQLIAIERVEEALAAEDRPGLELFAALLREEQQLGNQVLEAELRRAEESRLRERLDDLARAAGDAG